MSNHLYLKDAATIKAHLLTQLPRLVECLFAGRPVQCNAHEYRIGSHGSISIRRSDGCYYSYEEAKGGDIFGLVQHRLATDFRGALAFARQFCGYAPLPPLPPSSGTKKGGEKNAALRLHKALALYKRSTLIKATQAEAYLRQKRGITLESLPEALRYLECAYNYTSGAYHPAMLAPIVDVTGNVIAVHVTFLDPATGDKLRGDGIKPRLIFGACKGGAIRLSPIGNCIIICEGVEDGLSILQAMPDACVWVSAGTSGMVNIVLPECATEVIIASDNDPKGEGQKAAFKLALKLKKEGRSARIATPAHSKDYNELLLQGNLACLTSI